MRFILLAFLISSCSPRTTDNNALPRYSDMGAAEDAGKVK
jgi:hypothetical protein